MANIGDKFIIEIGEIFEGDLPEDAEGQMKPQLYRVKGFRSLVFDENGIEKLEPYVEPVPEMPKVPETTVSIGDEVQIISTEETFVITKIDGENKTAMGLTKDGSYLTAYASDLRPTGAKLPRCIIVEG